jgi:lipopolysaccharide transport system ATP-binding protein
MAGMAIAARGLSKQYRIGQFDRRYDTLRDHVVRTSRSLVRRGERERDRTIWALRDVSLDIAPGEMIGVVGKNGAGKTTLLRILARITEPTTGYVDVRGRLGSLLEVGTGFHPELTGRQNIYLNGSILGMRRSEIKAKFDEIVEFAEVAKFLDTPVKRYSSGMYVRLAFSVAAHLEPDVLLIDEVLAVGDLAFQQKSIGKMGDVVADGRTVIFVSHQTGIIRQLCPRSVLLEGGELVGDGPTDEILTAYLSSRARTDGGEISLDSHEGSKTHVRFLRAQLLNSHGNAVDIVAPGEPIRIAFHFRVLKAVREVRLCFTIGTGFGEQLLTVSNSDAPRGGLQSFEEGSYAVECTIPGVFRTGLYQVGLEAHQAGVATWACTVPSALQFHIDDRLNDSHYNHGILSLPAEWRLVRDEVTAPS